ncbi:peptidoglycan-N-acetylmuramic acid deacetylase [Oikeobacillus pervagus]|uniref:Peptidoglycan-N-acetylmuramic acid deacetylase n=1 Tax=Oikeobacillus pervagus TaxID=1325931 RepID=A0AAJ1T0U7_9BACI|nr:delta-lactam-biosynthetic de-N-acetylase [Oikeobacillus pervagus]MDQ0216580.1 peptidoglycan-N-acetylmuramic acid deacetylase [Oikeobacillus pervagus]
MRTIISLFIAFFISFTITVPSQAISNEPIHWGFKRSSNGVPPDAGEAYNTLLEKYDAFYKGKANKKVLYLTFDNGYENGYTAKILDTLKQEKVPATFFVTGHYLRSAPDLVRRMVKEGHIVGNHSWSHPDLTQVSDEKLKRELALVEEETAKMTKQKKMEYLRPPRGILSERTLKLAKEEGYTHVLWSLAFVDWQTNNQKGWQYSYDNIMTQAHPGAVILLHTVSKDNAEALEKALQDLKKQGYQFKSLDHYKKNPKKKAAE